MNSKFAFCIPLVSLLYFIATLKNKSLHKAVKTLLALLSIILLLINLFIAAAFYVNCWDVNHIFSNGECIRWIVPTTDYTLLLLLSLVLFTFAVFGLLKRWHRGIYYMFGTLVIYSGTVSMIYLLHDARDIIAVAIGSNSIIILDILSIAVVYGLTASVFYIGIFILGLFTSYIPRPKQG
jgi:hypothetical protein